MLLLLGSWKEVDDNAEVGRSERISGAARSSSGFCHARSLIVTIATPNGIRRDTIGEKNCNVWLKDDNEDEEKCIVNAARTPRRWSTYAPFIRRRYERNSSMQTDRLEA